MTEDFQDQYESYSKQKKNSKPNKKGMLLLAFIVWVIITTIVLLISKPKIDKAFADTNAVYVFKNRSLLREQMNTTETTVFFIKPETETEYTLLGFKTSVRKTGVSPFHDAVEALLKGPSDTALKHGVLTAIPAGTTLRGLTVSCNVAFIDLSKSFTENTKSKSKEYTETAKQQFLKTVQAVDPTINRVVILTEGIQN